MELIEYRGLQLDIINSINWEREALMDQAGGTTYECTRVRGNVIATYNPGAISYRFRNGSPSVVPAPTPGKMPEETDREIRRFLEQPRGELTVWSAGEIWLQSPTPPRTCDVRNGPFLRVNTIAKIPGERLWQISLELETYINEFPNASGSAYPPEIISNRWYAHDDTNWQHLRTRTYQGTCIVRGDVLKSQDAGSKFIDKLRNSFCAFSVPVGFQREQVKVTVTPDGNTAHYTVVDVEQLFNKSRNCPAVRVAVSDTSWTSKGSVGRALQSLGGMVGIAGQFAATSANAVAAGNARQAAAAIATGAFNQIMSISSAVNDNLPKAYRNIIVDCWGNQRTRRGDLMKIALGLVQTRLGPLPILNSSSSELIVRQNTDNFVQVSGTINYGIDGAAAIVGGLPGMVVEGISLIISGGNTGAVEAFNTGIGMTPNMQIDSTIISQSPFPLLPNVPFPASSGTRGTAAMPPSSPLLQTLLTQTLEGFDQEPAAVP